VGDEAHVRLVDAHAEGDGGDDDDALALDEARLPGAALVRGVAGVVGDGIEALRAQELGRLVHLAPRQAVDDAGVARVLVAQKLQQLPARLGLLDDAVADVRPVEAGDELLGPASSSRVTISLRVGRRRWP
jgi:hypothetical protein